MPKILITGNGFDLHHKLPTHYNDFMKVVKQILADTISSLYEID